VDRVRRVHPVISCIRMRLARTFLVQPFGRTAANSQIEVYDGVVDSSLFRLFRARVGPPWSRSLSDAVDRKNQILRARALWRRPNETLTRF
jgi:hypothetical protein